MKVVDSRQVLSNLRKRYYKCKCGYMPTTSERLDIEKPKKIKNNLK
jgi:transcriptional regulator NrdR family protein